ncbi:hypothetical protein G5I_03329 [Acromyrmex echinatior]|uniref:Uncharacterized protein n=1 Tax=Acromyrmex echinatior TaxID=103372 RepID=F4WCQ3_ACREC|nr:hypothetical protein G5I_03329 [Acromyrmex echinatior]
MREKDERERGRKLKRARDRVKRTRTSNGEKTARGRETTGAQATSSHSCRQGSVTTAQFVHSACGTVWGGSNERSLLGRAPTDESRRRTDGDLHPLCASSIDIWVSKCQYDVSDVTPMWDQSFCAPFRSGRPGTVYRSVSTPLSGIAVLDCEFDVDASEAHGTRVRSGAKRSEVREYILRSRNHSATVATKLQTISSSHRSSRKSLVGRTSMNQRGLLSIGRIWSSLDLPRSADREYDGRETGRTLFVSFRSGGEDMEWKGMRNKIKREKEKRDRKRE